MFADIPTVGALGRSFMATDTEKAGRALKMQKGWALVVTDHCYFIAELKWKMDQRQSLDQENAAYKNKAVKSGRLDRLPSLKFSSVAW